MAAKVFISHSCKDKEKKPPAGLTKEAAAARAKRLEVCRTLRQELYKKLKADKRFEVFLDVRGGLKAGEVWREGLHTALRTCSAGVVLLTPESLESQWVLKEATILSWRAFVKTPPVVLIVFVLDVAQEEIDRRGFGALGLDAIQWIDIANPTQAGIKKAVNEAVAALKNRVAQPLSDAELVEGPEEWIRSFAGLLSRIIGTARTALELSWLRKMCDELQIPPQDRDRFDDDPLVNIASHLLVADDNQVVRFLRHAGVPDETQRKTLKEWLTGLWVDATPASRVLARSKPVIAIDATELVTVREYLIRACWTKVDWTRVAEPSDATDGTDAAVLAEVKRALGSVVDIDTPAKLQADLEENGPAYVILGPSSTRPSILDAVTAAYPGVTFLVAAGAQPQDKLGAWYKRALLLYPLLQGATREQAGSRFRNKLLNFVQGTGS
jgi:TIR domain-containing protein